MHRTCRSPNARPALEPLEPRLFLAADHGHDAASAFPINLGNVAAGIISTSTDQDWWKVHLDTGHMYNIQTVLGTLTDTYLSVYDRDGWTWLAGNDDTGSTGASKMEVTPPTSGDYYVVVEGLRGPLDPDGMGNYAVRFTEVPYPGTISAKGRVVYVDNKGKRVPLRFVEVDLCSLSEDYYNPDTLLATAGTDAQGNFVFDTDAAGHPISNADPLPNTGTRDLYVSVVAANPAATVSQDWMESELGHYWQVYSDVRDDVPDGMQDFKDVILDPLYEDIGLILDNIAVAHDWLTGLTGWSRSRMTVQWPVGYWPGFVPYTEQDQFDADTIIFPDNLMRSFSDPQSVVVHEYGHAIQHAVRGGNLDLPADDEPKGTQAPPGGGHYIDSQAGPGFAFVEGWAEFFQCAVFNDPNLDDLSLENNHYWMGVDGRKTGINKDLNTGETVEGAVASILWTIYDPASGIDDGFDRLWTVFHDDRPNSIWSHDPNNDFYHDWVARYGESDTLDQIFLANGVPVRDEYLSPNLSVTLGKITLAHTIVPGDKGTVPVVIKNSGLQAAKGTVTVNLYASADGTVAGGVPLKTLSVALDLYPGAQQTVSIPLQFGKDMPVGAYTFVAEVDPDNTLNERTLDDNVAADATPRVFAWKFGTFDDRRNVRLTVASAGGTATTFGLTGKGYGEIIGRSAFDAVNIYGSDKATAVTISAAAGPPVSIGDVTITGSMSRFAGAAIDLRGNFSVTGTLATLTLRDLPGGGTVSINSGAVTVPPTLQLAIKFGRVTDTSLSTGGIPVRTLTAIEWQDAALPADSVTAPWIGTLTTTGQRAVPTKNVPALAGDFDAGLVLSGAVSPHLALATVKIAGSVTGLWQVTGAVGTLGIGHILTSLALGAVASVTTSSALVREVQAGVAKDLIAVEGAGAMNRLTFTSLKRWPKTLTDFASAGGPLVPEDVLAAMTLASLKNHCAVNLGKWTGSAAKLTPRLLASFGQTADPTYAYVRNVAYIYDNALAILALLAGAPDAESTARAFQIADALVLLQTFDPMNAQAAPDTQFPALVPALLRDAYAPGTVAPSRTATRVTVRTVKGITNASTGNQAYAAVALMRAADAAAAGADAARAADYLRTAKELLLYIGRNRQRPDPLRGFRMSADASVGMARSTENNIDLSLAFGQMAAAETDADLKTQWAEWQAWAEDFCNQMYGPNVRFGNLAWISDDWSYLRAGTGLQDDINIDLVPVDTGAWSALARGDTRDVAFDLLEFLATSKDASGRIYTGVDPGFRAVDDLALASLRDGVGAEATAYVALIARSLGDTAILNSLPARDTLKAEEQTAYDWVTAAANAGATDHDLADALVGQLAAIQLFAPNTDRLGLVAAPVRNVGTGEYSLVNGWSLAATCWTRCAYLGWNLLASTAV